MIGAEERRKAAVNLRAVRDKMEEEKPPSTLGAAATVYLQRIGYCVELSEAGNLFYRLAELIDCPICRNISTLADPDEFECSNCGNGLNIGDQLSGWQPIDYCPFCGAKVEEQYE